MFNALTDKNTTLGEEISENLGLNNWLVILMATFTFVPSSFG